MSYTASLTGAGWLVDPIINPKSGTPSSPYIATLGPQGWTVSPIVKPVAPTRGPELWVNPVLGTNWTDNGGGSYTHAAGASSNLSIANVLTAGKTYEMSFTVSGRTAGNVRALLGTGSAGAYTPNNGLYQFTAVASGTPSILINCESVFAGTVSGVSVREVLSA